MIRYVALDYTRKFRDNMKRSCVQACQACSMATMHSAQHLHSVTTRPGGPVPYTYRTKVHAGTLPLRVPCTYRLLGMEGDQ